MCISTMKLINSLVFIENVYLLKEKGTFHFKFKCAFNLKQILIMTETHEELRT